MGVLVGGIEEFSIETAESWPVEQLLDRVVVLRQQLDLLEIQWTHLVGLLTKVEPEALGGHPSVTAFLKHRCVLSATRAQRAVALAHRLPSMPSTSKAIEAGDLSLDQARVLAARPRRPRRPRWRDPRNRLRAGVDS